MNPPFEELFQYVFDKLPAQKKAAIEALLAEDIYLTEIVNGLFKMKQKFDGNEEKVKEYLKAKKKIIKDNLFSSKNS